MVYQSCWVNNIQPMQPTKASFFLEIVLIIPLVDYKIARSPIIIKSSLGPGMIQSQTLYYYKTYWRIP